MSLKSREVSYPPFGDSVAMVLGFTVAPSARISTRASAGETKCARRIAAAAAAVLLATTPHLAVNTVNGVEIFDHDKTLSNADFSGRDLRGAIFTKSVCRDANFKNAKLDGAQFDDGDVRFPVPKFPIIAVH